MTSSTKRLLSLVIVLAMALSMLPMVAFAADTILYVKPNSNWNIDGARFAAYFFGAGDTWLDCTDADGDGVYEVTVPAGGYTHVIFCRMNPKAAANTWSNKWNQTADLKLPTDSKICYVVAENTWDKGAGQWVEYTPEGGAGETEPTTPSPIKYSVAGEAGLCGSAWTPEDINNMMLDEDADGIYTITYTAVAAGSYMFKVTDGTWNNSWGGDGPDGNYQITLASATDVTINFNTADNSIQVIADGLEEPPVTEPPVTEPTEPFVPGVREYCLVGYINGADYGHEGDYENIGEYIFVDGTLTATFTADSYIYVKTTDNANWLMSAAYCQDTTCTFAVGNSEKMFVPGNVELTFTLVENQDGSVTVSYVTGGTVEPPVTEPTEPTEPDLTPKEYCLVGYINGADYGCNDDYENVGQYIFVDGTLTTSFSVDSYIFVKTTDNSKWYLAEAYCQDTTCTFVENATEKMYVPANVMLTFTLVENSDGTVTVSYVTGEASPDEPTEPSNPTEPSEPGAAVYYVAGSFNGWNCKDEAYRMNDNGDGTWSLDIAVEAGEVQLKVTNGTWDDGGNWGENGANIVVNPKENCTITVTFDGSKVTVTGADRDPLTINTVHVVGEVGLTGAEWDVTANQMTADGKVYTITFENVAAGRYEYKFAANGTWASNWGAGVETVSGETYTAWFNAMGNNTVVVAENGSTVTLTLDLTNMDIYTGEGGSCSALVEASAPGVTVSGNVTTGAAGDTTVELYNGETLVTSATVSGKTGTYSFDAVAAGTYTLKVSKANHVTREYTVTVADAALTQDVKIHLRGDIDGNGTVNMNDVTSLYAHVKGTKKITDEYKLLVVNVNGGSINMNDVTAVYAHVKGTRKLY